MGDFWCFRGHFIRVFMDVICVQSGIKATRDPGTRVKWTYLSHFWVIIGHFRALCGPFIAEIDGVYMKYTYIVYMA